MTGFGIGMAVRDFQCALCQQSFSRMSPDAILPPETICDRCLHDLSLLDEEHLKKHVMDALAGREIRDGELGQRIISIIRQARTEENTP